MWALPVRSQNYSNRFLYYITKHKPKSNNPLLSRGVIAINTSDCHLNFIPLLGGVARSAGVVARSAGVVN
jgi:hypothetical protein